MCSLQTHGAVLVNGTLQGTGRSGRVAIALTVAESSAHDILKTVMGEETDDTACNYLTRCGTAQSLSIVCGVVAAFADECLASSEETVVSMWIWA